MFENIKPQLSQREGGTISNPSVATPSTSFVLTKMCEDNTYSNNMEYL